LPNLNFKLKYIEMTIQILILIAGLLLILFGADYLVEGATNIAKKFGVSELVIGLTIVGLGTSTPEMVVSFLSAFEGNSSIALGNVVGSNIFNSALILGVTAILTPLTITKASLKRDIPVNIIATTLLILLGMKYTIFGVGENILTRVDALVLLIFFAGYMYISFKNDNLEESEEGCETEAGSAEKGKGLNLKNLAKSSMWISTAMIIGGLGGLVWGGNLFVDSATALAKMFGVSDKFIAVTIMAGGTSMPELATCVVAALKGRGQLALGNVLGSSIGNILLILGGSAMIQPLSFAEITFFDLGAMLACALIIMMTAFVIGRNKITRTEGVILLLIEIAYSAYLISSL
jgi:cation:H+ antiporter